MYKQSWKLGVVPLAFAAVSAAAPRLSAQEGTPVVTWNGIVDREVRITIRGSNAVTRLVGPAEPTGSRVRIENPLPRQEGVLNVQLENGRGRVDVIQQPSSENNYTAIIRVRDPAAGSGRYRFTAYWEAESGGEVVEPLNPTPTYPYGRRDIRRSAVGTGALHWTGNIDDVVLIYVRGGTIQYRTMSGK